jgi:hypothetical protein
MSFDTGLVCWVRAAASIAPVLMLVGCGSVTIRQPANMTQISTTTATANVQITVDIGADRSSETITLTGPNGADDLVNGPHKLNFTPGVNAPDHYDGVVALPPGQYTLSASGVNAGRQMSDSRSFTVVASAPQPSISLTVTPNPILVPRKGNVSVTFALTRANSASGANVTATNLPADVTLQPPPMANFPGGTSQTVTGSLSAKATATGSANAKFTATLGTGEKEDKTVAVKVLPAPGAFAFQQAPSLGNAGPGTPASMDGVYTTTVSRMGASRVWTFTFHNSNGSTFDVPMATWAGAGGSNLGGVLFCKGNPTTTAIVFSDIDENPNPPPGRVNYSYQVKIIRLINPTGVATSVQNVKYQYGVVPQVGFSTDCSLVAGWGAGAFNSDRDLQVANGLNSQQLATWSYTDTSTSLNATASVSGANLVLTGPNNQSRTVAIP